MVTDIRLKSKELSTGCILNKMIEIALPGVWAASNDNIEKVLIGDMCCIVRHLKNSQYLQRPLRMFCQSQRSNAHAVGGAGFRTQVLQPTLGVGGGAVFRTQVLKSTSSCGRGWFQDPSLETDPMGMGWGCFQDSGLEINIFLWEGLVSGPKS